MSTVELRLTGVALQTLADNGHVKGWPGRVAEERVEANDPDRDLHLAVARWYVTSASRKVGARGWIHVGPIDPDGAVAILEYLESVSGSLLCADVDNPEARAEGRAVGRAVDQAIEHMRRQGVTVLEADDGPSVKYAIEA